MNFDGLLQELDERLLKVGAYEFSSSKESTKAIFICRDVLTKMNALVLSCSFKDESEEIYFFKEIKLRPLSHLIYYSKVRLFHLKYPKVGIEDKKKYVRKQFRKLNKFYSYNSEFVEYVHQNSTSFDSVYYLRSGNEMLNYVTSKPYYLSSSFSTSHDMLLATLMANDEFFKFLNNKWERLHHSRLLPKSHKKGKKVKWTSSSAALTELIYALHASGSLNSGNLSLKEIAYLFENIFNFELGDFYRTYLEISSRKKTRTKFLDLMKSSLISRMIESDR